MISCAKGNWLCQFVLRLCSISIVLIAQYYSTTATAHVIWAQVNAIDPSTLGLYHFSADPLSSGSLITPAFGLPANRSLVVGAPAGLDMAPSTSLPGSIFGSSSLAINSAQMAISQQVFPDLEGDLTLECWFKWNLDMTTSVLTFGLEKGAKVYVAHNVANHSEDRLGLLGKNNSYISAPGFVSWPDVGEEEADLNTWRHLGICIHSTGLETIAGESVYKSGSVVRLLWNGHPWGFNPFTFSIAGLKAEPQSALALGVLSGGKVTVDEFTVWKYDWTQNGSVLNPFANGRGSGTSNIPDWTIY